MARSLHTAFAERRAQSELIYNWYVESLHNRTRVLSKALLAWDEFVAMVSVFHLALLHVGGESYIMMGSEQQTCPLAVQPLSNCRYFVRSSLLLGNQMVQEPNTISPYLCRPKTRPSIGKLISCLVNSLKKTATGWYSVTSPTTF